jgi:hypothetical protein
MSFYSATLYRDVIENRQNLGLCYLLFLVMLGVMPLSGRVMVAFNDFFKQDILFPMQSLPLLTIQDGEISYHQAMPYFIKNSKGDVVSVIDTTGVVSDFNAIYPQLNILVTKHQIAFRPPNYRQFLGLARDVRDNPIDTRIFDKEINGLFSGTEWVTSSGISTLNMLMQIMIFPCIVLFYFFVFALMLLVFAAINQLYGDIFFKLKLSFKMSYRLLVVAVTPALMLFFVMRSMGITAPGMGFTYGILFLGYTSYGLYAANRSTA